MKNMIRTKHLKSISAFAAGMFAMAVLVTMATPIFADGGEIAYNQVGIRVMREPQVKAGETYTAPNGQQIPSVITYTDAAGGKSNYISVRQLEDLIDADISWDSESNSVDIGVFSPPGNVSISMEVESSDQEPDPTPANAPEYGLTIGNLEEIDPETVQDVVTADPKVYPGGMMYAYNTRVQYSDGGFPDITASPRYANGEYLVYTVTNNGQIPKEVKVSRKISVSLGRWEKFPTIYVQPGETLVRVFRVLPDEETHPMQRTFDFGVGGSSDYHDDADVTVSLVQYQGSL